MVQFDANADAYVKVDTVARVQVKDERPLKECTGHQDNGRDTDDKVDLRPATYSVSVHEATTGKELGTTGLSGSDDSCPTIVSFDNDNQTKVYDTPPSSDDLVAFLNTVRTAVSLSRAQKKPSPGLLSGRVPVWGYQRV